MPFVEGREYLLGGDGACTDALLGHGLQALLKGFAAFGEDRQRAGGPRGPRAVMGFDGFGKVDITGDVRAFVPFWE